MPRDHTEAPMLRRSHAADAEARRQLQFCCWAAFGAGSRRRREALGVCVCDCSAIARALALASLSERVESLLDAIKQRSWYV